MHLEFQRFALICVLAGTLNTTVLAAQKNTKATPNLPAGPQAKTSQPATHFTQGTITSIEANQLVITRKVRGKADQTTFSLNSQTQRSGNLVAGSRVSVQYREADHQKIAAAVRELAEKADSAGKASSKPRPKG